MPQMAPMPWLSILIFTLVILYSSSTMIYFLVKPTNNNITTNKLHFFSIKW